MVSLALLTTGWIAALRRRVRVQTELIQQRLEREKALEVRYRELFESNPHSMWVYDKETLAFLAVNDAAVHHYAYTRDEFLRMTLDIHPSTTWTLQCRSSARLAIKVSKKDLAETSKAEWSDHRCRGRFSSTDLCGPGSPARSGH
jgi:PAS domain-containing protein